MSSVRLSMCFTGQCKHPEISTRRDGSLRSCVYPMFAGVIERDGEITVFDPGYAPRFREATEPFPDRFYRWMTPALTPAGSAIAAQLKAAGRFDAVRTIVLSHFHADHIAGLADFPEARIVCSRVAFDHFVKRSGFAAVSSGYLKRLAPADLARRVRFVEDLPRATFGNDFAPFTDAHDLFGDRSVMLTPLTGHAVGQVGAVISCGDGAKRFLIADAAWSRSALLANAPPPWATMRFLGRPSEYMKTWTRLRTLAARNPDVALIPAHCSEAAAGVGAALA